ncbi:hypothetical protein CV014_11845 [Nostoc sp. CMAA1605]|nr:hypothetical protein [Nostoc sp. CMAA1605]
MRYDTAQIFGKFEVDTYQLYFWRDQKLLRKLRENILKFSNYQISWRIGDWGLGTGEQEKKKQEVYLTSQK